MDIKEIVAALNEAEEAKGILDQILSHWHPYSGEINLPDYEKTFDSHSLMMRIRDYINFDDSE